MLGCVVPYWGTLAAEAAQTVRWLALLIGETTVEDYFRPGSVVLVDLEPRKIGDAQNKMWVWDPKRYLVV